jgi:microcystin-dependent protein
MSTSLPRAALDRRTFLGRMTTFAAATALFGRARRAHAATQGSEPYIGEIMLVSWNFPPKGWAFCSGQLLPINQNQALFSILGTTYGGNGQTTFALPDLRGRVPIHFGQGPGLSPRSLGERAGEINHTLSSVEVPAHGHGIQASSATATAALPTGMFPARNAALVPQYALAPADLGMAPAAVGNTGGSQPHPNQQPYLVINFAIALVGLYPS